MSEVNYENFDNALKIIKLHSETIGNHWQSIGLIVSFQENFNARQTLSKNANNMYTKWYIKQQGIMCKISLQKSKIIFWKQTNKVCQ